MLPFYTPFLSFLRDIANLMEAPPSGMMIHVPEDDFTEIHAIIPGPSGTPYCGGFFYFILKCTSEYPLAPPKVRLMTTGAGTVRFSPNFYSDGKVCLSILRTWYGPGWLPTMTLEGVLLSIQSVMSTNPLHNEPGFNPEESGPCEVLDYNLYVATETLQTAVAGMLQDRNIPEPLQEFMQKSFVKNFSLYEELAVKNMMEAPKFMA
ncbi:Ubiquitin-conjugating enzyme E2 Z, partial [Frankliniella fusca]